MPDQRLSAVLKSFDHFLRVIDPDDLAELGAAFRDERSRHAVALARFNDGGGNGKLPAFRFAVLTQAARGSLINELAVLNRRIEEEIALRGETWAALHMGDVLATHLPSLVTPPTAPASPPTASAAA